MQLKYRERFVDDESFIVSVDSRHRPRPIEITGESLISNNFYTRIPPQFENNNRIKQIFENFQAELAEELLDHVAKYSERIHWSKEVNFFTNYQ